MPLTVKRLEFLGRVVSVSWMDGATQNSLALDTGTDAEIRTRLGADTIILPADPVIAAKSKIVEVSVEDFRTANATQATMVAWPLALQTLYTARFTITAIDVVNGDCKAWYAMATAKRLGAGALPIGGQGTILSSHADTGAAAWAINADTSGNDFRIRVTGAAGRTISWSLIGHVMRARPDGLVD